LIQQNDDPALAVTAVVHESKPKSAQLTHGCKVFLGKSCLRILPEPHHLSDDEAAFAVVLGLAYINLAERFRLDGVDDTNIIFLLGQILIDRQPVVAGCLYTDYDIVLFNGEPSEKRKELVASLFAVNDCSAVKQRFSIGIDNRRFVVSLGNIDSGVKE